MIQPRRYWLPVLVLLCAPGAFAAAPSALPAPIEEALAKHHLSRQAVSIVVRDAHSGESLLEFNPTTPRSPASTMKVLTTVAALDALGPNYHWHTRAYATAPIVDGRLAGDLVIQGGGDPFMSAERWWSFARALRSAGLSRIEGDLVLDRSLYALAHTDPEEFDGQGSRTYNVVPDALLVNLQAAEFHLIPGATDVQIVVDPHPTTLEIANGIEMLEGACRADTASVSITPDAANPRRLMLQGHVAAGCKGMTLRRAILDPPAYAFGTFVDFWRGLGGEFSGTLRLDALPREATLIADYPSLSLGETVRLVNKYSSNVMARMFLLTLGLERHGPPASERSGQEAVSEWLASRGLRFPELVMDNGSGLSRISRISADSLERVLRLAHHHAYFPEFAASLPLGGQDGTLEHRFRDLAAEGRVRLKTGHLNDVAAVAGWVRPKRRAPVSVVVIVNQPGAQSGPGDALIDAVVRWALAH